MLGLLRVRLDLLSDELSLGRLQVLLLLERLDVLAAHVLDEVVGDL
jgi:hypothetical protein